MRHLLYLNDECAGLWLTSDAWTAGQRKDTLRFHKQNLYFIWFIYFKERCFNGTNLNLPDWLKKMQLQCRALCAVECIQKSKISVCTIWFRSITISYKQVGTGVFEEWFCVQCEMCSPPLHKLLASSMCMCAEHYVHGTIHKNKNNKTENNRSQ